MACITCLHIFGINDTSVSDVVIDAELLEDIIPDMDLKFDVKPIICTECDEKLHQLRNFKNNCDIIQDTIRKHIDDLDITDCNILHKINVLLGRIKSENSGRIACCRLCLKISEEESSMMKAQSCKLLISVLAPEVDLDVSEEPVICENCVNLIEDLYHFHETYSHIQRVLQERLPNKVLSSLSQLIDIGRDQVRGHAMKQIKCEQVEIKEEQEAETFENHSMDFSGSFNMTLSKLNLTENNYKCKECDFVTKNKAYFKQHLKDKHDDSNWLTCSYCQYRTKRPFCLSQHIFHKHDETKERYKCKECDFESKYKSSIKQHIRVKHTHTDDLFTCHQCSYQTSQRRYLVSHFKDVHQANTNVYVCNFCDHQTKSLMLLKRHVKIKHDQTIPVHHCPYCDHKTKFPYHLKEHIKIFHDEASKIYRCDNCEYSTRNITAFRRHNKSKHQQTEEKRFTCEYCPFVTKHSGSLVIHIKGMHGKGKDYNCHHCDFKTKHVSYLKTHILVKHTPDSKMKCTRCSFTTMYKSSLNKHIRMRHEGGKLKKCKYCDFESMYLASLKRHFLKKHSEYDIKRETDAKIKIEEVEIGDTELLEAIP